jgi:chromosome segregation ATPase
MDDASKAADRLWGPARLQQMKNVNNALREEIEGLKKKRQEAAKYDKDGKLVGGYLKEDKDALKDTIKAEAGINITDIDFDDKGNFIKYDEVLNPLFEELNAVITAANADGNADEDEQEKIDKIQERIDKIKEAIDQYDETKELVEDLDNDIQDKIYEWQDNNYEQLNYKLELELEINDSELELVEYYMGKAEGDIYKTAEAFGYLNQQAGLYEDNLKEQEAYVNELHRAY